MSSKPIIRRVEIVEFLHEARDLGTDYNGFNHVYEPGALAKAHAELDLVPCVLQVVPRGQLVQPAPMELRTPEALGLRGRDALDQAPIDQAQLVVLLVVVGHQRRGYDGAES